MFRRRNVQHHIFRSATAAFVISSFCLAQSTITVTGTPIPAGLLRQNYGKMPKGVGAFDLSICNTANARQSVTASEIYQALSQTNANLRPIGRQLMLASILRNENRNFWTILGVSANAAAGIISALSASRFSPPAGAVTGVALASLSIQQIISSVKPILPADKLEKFDSQVLELALVLDSGSCVERTVFTLVDDPKTPPSPLNFRVRSQQ